MKKALVMLLAAAIVGAGVTPAQAEVSAKKKSVAAKKKPQRVSVQFRGKKVTHWCIEAPRAAGLPPERWSLKTTNKEIAEATKLSGQAVSRATTRLIEKKRWGRSSRPETMQSYDSSMDAHIRERF